MIELFQYEAMLPTISFWLEVHVFIPAEDNLTVVTYPSAPFIFIMKPFMLRIVNVLQDIGEGLLNF